MDGLLLRAAGAVGRGVRRTSSWAVLVALGMAAPAGLAAQESCSSAALTTAELQECADRRARALDSLRIEVEGAITSGLDYEQLREFERARDHWLEFRSTQCRFESRDAGSMALMLFLDCHMGLSAERIERLSPLVCEGGALTGTCGAAEEYRSALRRLVEE